MKSGFVGVDFDKYINLFILSPMIVGLFHFNFLANFIWVLFSDVVFQSLCLNPS